jgi:hypothetical protein
MKPRALSVLLLLAVLAACSMRDTTSPETPLIRIRWQPVGTGSGDECGMSLRAAPLVNLEDCEEWESRPPGSRPYGAWAAPLAFGPYVWLDDHIRKVAYTVTAQPLGEGAVLTGEVKYADGAGSWLYKQFAAEVYFVTGNAVASVQAHFKNNNPTGTFVDGRIYW